MFLSPSYSDPIHGYNSAIATQPSHHDQQQQRLTLWIVQTPNPTDMAPPAGTDRRHQTDDGGLLSHTIEVS